MGTVMVLPVPIPTPGGVVAATAATTSSSGTAAAAAGGGAGGATGSSSSSSSNSAIVVSVATLAAPAGTVDSTDPSSTTTGGGGGGWDLSSVCYTMPLDYHGDVHQAAALLFLPLDAGDPATGGGAQWCSINSDPSQISPQLPASATASAATSTTPTSSTTSAAAAVVAAAHIPLPARSPLLYWQGADSLCSVPLRLFWPREDIAARVASRVVAKYLRGVYVADNAIIVGRMLGLYSELLTFHDPILSAHLHRVGFTADIYALPWFLTLFSHALPPEHTAMVWDTLLTHPPEVLLHLALALVTQHRRALLAADAGGCRAVLTKALARLDVPSVWDPAGRVRGVAVGGGRRRCGGGGGKGAQGCCCRCQGCCRCCRCYGCYCCRSVPC